MRRPPPLPPTHPPPPCPPRSHGYGLRDPTKPESGDNAWFYPGSGAPVGWDAGGVDRLRGGELAGAAAPLSPSAAAAATAGGSARGAVPAKRRHPPLEHARFLSPTTETGEAAGVSLQPPGGGVPEALFEARVRQPHIINVGLRRGVGPKGWRRLLTADVLPRLAEFSPDLILISAGFDAHQKDTINWGYLSLTEDDYEWVTRQLVKVANATCGGRIVSVLEGGYRIQVGARTCVCDGRGGMGG